VSLPAPPPGTGPPSASIDIPPEPVAERTSRAPLVVASVLVLLLIGIVVGVGVWIASPGRCDAATFRSQAFGYCVAEPEGWMGGEATVGDVRVDQFVPQEGEANVYVQEVTVPAGESLGGFAETIRGLDREAGLEVAPTDPIEIDGAPGMQWDLVDPEEPGVRVREIVVVHEGSGWRIQFAESAETFDQSLPAFADMLTSWRFT
jgi:hypothetical protein